MNARVAGWASISGLLVGAVALVLAAMHLAAGPFQKPPPVEEVIAKKAQSIYERALDLLSEDPVIAEGTPELEPAAPDERDLDQIVRGATAGLGALAIALGIAGFARREGLRACGGAVVLGVAALPWQLGLAVLIAIVMVSLAPRVGLTAQT